MIGIIRKFTFSYIRSKKSSKAVQIIGTGISLFIVLAGIRANIVHLYWGKGLSLITFIPRTIVSAYHDFGFVLALTLLFGTVYFFLRDKKLYHNSILNFYIFISILTVIAAVLNKKAISVIGSPFSYQWLYYSDFMGSRDSQNAMIANVSWSLFLQIAGSLFLLFLMAEFFKILISYLISLKFSEYKVSLGLAAGVFLISYSLISNWYQSHKGWQYTQLANPVTYFIQSSLKADKSGFLFSMKVDGEFDDMPASKNTVRSASFQSTSPNPKIKNVIIFVLESVPAEYLDIYGGRFNLTPEINKVIPNSTWFKNVYAHSPATNNAMISILGSHYPWISYKSLTKEYPGIKLNTIGKLLKQSNYRTAFYSAGDTKFQRLGEFLSHQQFDKLEDFTSPYCRDQQFIVKGKRWESPDGADEECMINSFTDWIDEDLKRPFFTTFWTVQTHYPYFYSGKEKDYRVNNPDLNRYLNALHHSDEVFGKLMSTLKSRGLDESTLVVITGDHGEAFGRHQQFTHASKIYEENIRVPLIFVNKSLFQGERNDMVSGQVDIAPTIMNLLGYPADEQWQGHDLFGERKTNRAYFFAPWSDFLFGFRENNHKFIYNASKNITEVYDLEQDPAESVNLAGQLSPEYVDKGHKRLAQWVQYQDRFIRGSIAR